VRWMGSPNYFAINGFSCSINGQSPEKDTTPPEVPGISYTDLKSNQVEIHWQAVTDDQTPEDEISYEVFLNDQLITTFSGTSYLINTLKPGDNYKIYIKAVDLSGNRSVSNVLNITTPKIDQICDYDVSKDQFQVVNEYQTTAVSGWYSDTFSTPVTTVDGVIYFVYITPGFNVKVGKIFNGFVEEYYVDSDVSMNNDAHNEFSIAVDKQGYIHIAGGAHNSSLYYWRSAKPYDVSNFVEYPNAMPGNAFTYNFFRVDNNGELYMVSRVQAKSPWWQVGGRGVGL
ncbi:BNR-4 repeat-containing protein, partial [Facilibium subflavum]|uniref:BNR-4 repeat-containing protein n=1 Tax=Facilibium subflavum TaxID=2219058 RepID=UPI001AAD860A